MSENCENAHYNFSEATLKSTNVLFYPINSPKPKHIQLTVLKNGEKLQNLTLFGVQPVE